ncbi:hypothetical protein FTO68_06285 [Methanocalculus taiwanensis]|uniref:Uncharacterized protein n=1 Tax=Methanocalculus taiwanensis TaxID=106207 RepID=A0ABD4TLF0_9EURY|nr:hypothetical protein [Methanocalculus taiwanensis]MCQ1538593.1 hypothetical protein [Methanocalculus taiwanensis]
MLRNWARGGAASIGYSGFTALIIIPDPEIDPSEYVIPPEWWAESDPDRRRRAAWVAGAGGRFSGALSGEMRGI